MAVSTTVLDADELNPTDRVILDALQEHPKTPAKIALDSRYSQGNVRSRLNHLKSHGHVESIGGSMWSLVCDPRVDE